VSAHKSTDSRTETQIETEAAAWLIHMEGEATPEDRVRFDARRCVRRARPLTLIY
jgi:ferric-dicitrate binding protein FerR (iron transport regulator)